MVVGTRRLVVSADDTVVGMTSLGYHAHFLDYIKIKIKIKIKSREGSTSA
jgi:hypothetical protein